MDLITYIPDLAAMRAESLEIQDTDSALATYFTVDDSKVSFNVAKVPVVRTKENQSLCLIRGIPRAVLDLSQSIKVIGHVTSGEYIFEDDGQAIYEGVYDTESRMIDDGEGGEFLYTPPYKIGMFA